MSDHTVSAGELGYFLNGLTPRRVQQLAADGVVFKSGRGRYNLSESVRGYCAYMQRLNSAAQGEPDTFYGDAKNQKMRADADKAIMEAAQLAGNLVPAEIVAFQWSHMVGAFRAKLLNLPKKAAPLVQHETTFRKCNAALSEAIRECLGELSQYEAPDKHYGDLEQFLIGSAPKVDRKRVGRKKKKVIKRGKRRAG